jgi:predicted DNA-binding transcriptional regulator YafY
MDWFGGRRQKYIEVMLSWYGRFSAKQMIEYFGISRVQASKDIAYFREVNPDTMDYSNRERRYQMVPKVSESKRMDDPEAIFQFASENSPLPSVTVVPKLKRNIELKHIHNITWAISNTKQVEITYTSQNQPEGTRRVIQPFELIYASARWHVRAYCMSRNDFRDFSLSRILDSKRKDGFEERGLCVNDSDWNKIVTLKIQPHPKLDLHAKEILKREYRMVAGMIQLEVRAALVGYTIQENRVAVSDKYSPKEYHLVLENQDELSNYLW